jgi:hypothetical protein
MELNAQTHTGTQKILITTFRLFATFGRHYKGTRRVSCRPNVSGVSVGMERSGMT